MQTDSPAAVPGEGTFVPPHPGSQQMPRWEAGPLLDAPRFTWRNWVAMLGPGLVAGGSAIGGGEWLLGPKVTAVYGGALLWLVTISILAQVIYNIEISRYTLYSGEPIFTGKFRTLPGPMFWMCAYLVLDFGTIFPYLASNAATPLATLIKGGVVPDPDHVRGDFWLMKALAIAVFLLGMVPLLFGGKVYNSLKALMSFKVVVVLGFLTLTAVLYSHASTWNEIVTGFFRFGTVPIKRVELPEPKSAVDSAPPWDGEGVKAEPASAVKPPPKPGEVDNVFVALWEGRPLHGALDFSLIAFIAALAAIAGNGGLTNTPISNYTRDQGWGMGHHVGAIPSMIGGHNIQLSHVGCVFDPNEENLPRWRRWYRHVVRDQLAVWMPACFIGIALPSMLSVEFLPRGTETNDWNTAVMTASAVQERVTGISGAAMGTGFWFMVIFCGFLVLAPSVASTADGFVRRWVDVFWTSSGRLRALDPGQIKKVYFYVLMGFSAFGLVNLVLGTPADLIKYSTMIYNIALGVSCWHTLVLNSVLLPKPLRPGWFVRVTMGLAGVFFLTLGVITVVDRLQDLFK